MRYDEFRDRWQSALRTARLLAYHDRPAETFDVTTGERRWKVYVGHQLPQRSEPFHVAARLGFRWDPFEAARSYTCEEDLLTELLGRRVGRSATQPRLLRIDLTLHATLPHGSTTPTPAPDIWAPWVASVEEKLEKMLPAVSGGRKAMVMGWRGDVEISARFTPDATFSLLGISVSAFQFVQIPRIWDNPKRREKEKGPNKQLDQLARRFRSALDVWMASIGELGRWIRYTPGPPGRPSPRGGAGPFRDDGPETTH